MMFTELNTVDSADGYTFHKFCAGTRVHPSGGRRGTGARG